MGSNEFLVVANRLPVDKVGDHYEVSPGGLVAALAPVLRSRGGCWVGWPGDTSAELEPFEFNGISLVPVCLDQDDFEGFYEGFSNSTLWPLYHDLIVTPSTGRSGGSATSPSTKSLRGRPPKPLAKTPRCGCRTTSFSSYRGCCANYAPT